ncbi:MAG: hypothetical protein ABFS03_00955 [Chloroflexota bacterium]
MQFVVTSPDGRKLKVTGDRMPNEQELQDIFAAQAPKQKQTVTRESLLRDIAAEQSPLEAGLIATGRGLTKIGRGLGLVDPESPIEKQAFEALKEKRPVSTFIGEVAGESAPFLLPGLGVGAIASVPARVAATAALGASEGGLISRGEGRSDIETAGMAGLGGVVAGSMELVMPRIMRIGGSLVRRITGKSPKGALLTPDGAPTKELQDALEKSGLSFDDLAEQAKRELGGAKVGASPEQVARIAAFKEVDPDLVPTKAQITRDATDFQAQQEAFKKTGAVREAIEAQEEILSNKFSGTIANTGGRPITSTSTVTDHITNKATALDDEISSLYGIARERASGAKNVHFGQTVKALRESQSSKSIDNGLWDSVRAELMAKKVIDKKGKVIGTIDVNTAENIKQFINQSFSSTNDRGRMTSRLIKDAIDQDVTKAAGEDVFKQARRAKHVFERDLSKSKINKFDSFKRSLVRDILENKIDPDQLVDKTVFSKSVRASELKQVKDYLHTGTPDQMVAGKQAWNDLRAETLQKMKDIAFTGGEDKAITRASLDRAMNRVGKDKIRVLFDGKEIKFLEDLKRVAELREPKRGTFTGEGPSAQAIKNLQNRLEDIPAIGALIKGIALDRQGKIVITPAPTIIKPEQKMINQLTPALSLPVAAAVTSDE